MRNFLLALSCSWLLAGCATSADVPTVLSAPVDSTLQNQVADARAKQLVANLTTGKVKFKGQVTIQLGGTGNTATTTNASKAKAPVAAAPHATATQTKTSAGIPWYVYAGGVLLVFAGGFLVRGRLKFPLPF